MALKANEEPKSALNFFLTEECCALYLTFVEKCKTQQKPNDLKHLTDHNECSWDKWFLLLYLLHNYIRSCCPHFESEHADKRQTCPWSKQN